MANNRLYLRCKGCGSLFMLAKRAGDPYSIFDPDTFAERLGAWFQGHGWCDGGLDGIALEFEDEPEPALLTWKKFPHAGQSQ